MGTKSVLPALMAVVLVVGLNPATAFAAEQSARGNSAVNLSAGSSQQLQASELGVQDGFEFVAMTLDEMYYASLEKGTYWYGSFTAEHAGTYAFTTHGDSSTYGWLFTDAGLTEYLEENGSGGEGGNFLVKCDLEANQTVYLKVRALGDYGQTGHCSIKVFEYDDHDLSNARLSIVGANVFELTENPVVLSTRVVDALENTLTADTDYTLVYRNENQEELSGAPTSVGGYYVSARAIQGGSYTGETAKLYFWIVSPYDIESSFFGYYWNWNNGSSNARIDYTGSAVVLPSLEVYHYSQGNRVSLTEGTDFEFAYCYRNNLDYSIEKFSGTPKDVGDYYAVYKGIGSYEGTLCCKFEIVYGSKNLNSARITMGTSNIAYTGSAVQLGVTVSDSAGNVLKEGRDYKLEYCTEDSYNHGGTELLDSAPSKMGNYYFRVAAIEGSGYTGILRWWSFKISYPDDAAKASVPSAQAGLVYDGKPKTGVVAGEGYTVKGGSATAAGSYKAVASLKPGYIWSDGTFNDREISWSIAKKAQTVTVSKATVPKTFGAKAFSLGAKTDGDGKLSYKSSNAKVATVSSTGKVTIKGVGTAKITVSAAEGANCKAAASKTVTVKVAKSANTLAVKAVKATQTAKASKATTIKAAKAFKVTKNISKGKVTYKLSSASGKAKNKVKVFSTGKVLVAKGVAKGTYTIKVVATSAATVNYKSASKTITFKLNVK